MLELAGIIILGILAQWFAWKFKIPAILPLILIGLLVGPVATFISEDGHPWIQPIWDGHRGLFPGENLFYFVSLAIGIILFEGGLTLKRGEVTKVGPVIGKLISLGAAITFLGGGLAAHYIFGLNWRISFLFSSLIIVTGPTVISPILRNIPLKKDVSAVLKWEGILIDPIGALVAVLVFEFISIEGDAGYSKQALIEFGKIVLIGFAFGISGGYALYFAIKKRLIPHYLMNVVALSVVLMVFVISDYFAHESGLLSVVVMGMFLGNSDLPSLKELLYFKESLSVLLISILFILLAANIAVDDALLVYNWKAALLLAVVIFVLRPLSVFASTVNSSLKFNEKLFISWVGPRGIVAAGIASLFGTKLVQLGFDGAQYITPLVFAVVLVTVLLNATTARLFASVVGVFLKTSEGILIVGASKVSRLIASYLQKNGRHVVLVDSNQANVAQAQELNLEAITANIYAEDLAADIELSDVGYLLALTGSQEVNRQAINRFGKIFGETGTFRLMSSEEKELGEELNQKELFSTTHDYVSLEEVARTYPSIQEIPVKSSPQFLKMLSIIEKDNDTIALFLKMPNGFLEIIANPKEMEVRDGCLLVYLGKPLDIEELNQVTRDRKSGKS
ncbi:MAG TPA: cation:proton antiporter [Flavobacteriaceae bacterium]|nr:cation:proton antiporter [Flavobacteriaceae bacterium]MCB9211962.1 cation:proton antiporter [Alteromonas sp.]HPF09944.1 cation:proton antiporter [Flavobacteriaceae bacterium]HQU20041.1 cation:proton antiporter [Flavobacteriaceae bacterium]HQU63973.1 cation:proton antiporter [Flavobacteriaceae bacterium]